MRKLMVALLFVAATPVWAQEVTKPPEPPKEFTFTLTADEINQVGAALQEMPFKQVAPLLNKIQAQYNAQVPPVGQPDSTESTKDNDKDKDKK